MPLSEFLRMSRRKHESDQQMSTTHLTDLSSIPEYDFVELVWDNGQPAMHEQSSRVKKSHNLNDSPSHMPKPRGKYLANANSSRKAKIDSVESFLDDGLPGVPSVDTDLNQHGDLVPWLNYPVGEFLPEVSGVTVSEQAIHNSLSSMNKSSCTQTFGHLQNFFVPNPQKLEQSISMNGTSSRTGLMPLRSSRQEQTSIPSFITGVSDFASCSASTTKDAVMQDSVQDQPSTNGYLDMRMQKPDLALPGPASRSSLPNFPFISRYTSLQKANPSHTADPTASCSLLEAMANKEKSPANGTAPVESGELLASNLQKENKFNNQSPNSNKLDQRPSGSQLCEQSGLVNKSFEDQIPLGSVPCEQSCLVKKSYELCQEDQEKNDNSLHQVIGSDSNKRVSDDVKASEPIVSASSVCSGSSGDRASNDQPGLKRKCHDNEEYEYRSEDVEEESVGVRKAAPTRGGSKRGRAAEVHNLSERRRRDRINEKMRALQELIPSCNKTDKASMLDEAIEYLKTLQLQVQVMSMGTGLWMPPMMFPSGVRHIHATHMPNLSPLGIGVGFGMNMLDMNSGFPMFPVPPMQHPHFPSQSLSRPANFSGLVGPNIPVLGHPGQGHPISVPRAPSVPFSSHTTTSSSTGMGVTTVGFQMEVPSASPTPNTANPAEDKDAQLVHDADVSRLVSHTSNKLLQTNECTGQLNQSQQHKSNQATNVDVNLADGNIVPERKAGSS